MLAVDASEAAAVVNSICFLLPYFGKWPEWINLTVRSCAASPTIDWVFVTDCGIPPDPPANARFVAMTWAECASRVKDKCGTNRPPSYPYKLCDFKFAYGHIFDEYVAGYDLFAFGDIDVIYGDLRRFLPDSVLRHDLITFNLTHVSGHLTLMKNVKRIVERYRGSLRWRQAIDRPDYQWLDETNGFYDIDDVYALESFNTPLSPYIPWTDGRFVFPYAWYYKSGRLYTNLDGDRDFLYLHLMRYRKMWRARRLARVVHLDERDNRSNWTLLPSGFHPYSPGDELRDRHKRIVIGRPRRDDRENCDLAARIGDEKSPLESKGGG